MRPRYGYGNVWGLRPARTRSKLYVILALITLTDKIKQVIDNGEYAIGIYLDLKKAFDTANHDILFLKKQSITVYEDKPIH